MREQEQDIYVSKLQVIKKKLIPKKKRKKIFTMNWTKGRMDGGAAGAEFVTTEVECVWRLKSKRNGR